jgi:hypothetical protein
MVGRYWDLLYVSAGCMSVCVVIQTTKEKTRTGRRTVAAGFVLAAVVEVVVQVVPLFQSRSWAANERRQSTARNQYWHPPLTIRERRNGPNLQFQQQ